MEGTVVAIDLGKFGTAYAWRSDGNTIPSVGNLDAQEPGEEIHHKSPNSLLVPTEAGTDGNLKPCLGGASFGKTAETRYVDATNFPVGAQLFRRFGLQQSSQFDVGPCASISVNSWSNVLEIEVEEILVTLLAHVRHVSTGSRCKGRPCLRRRVGKYLTVCFFDGWSCLESIVKTGPEKLDANAMKPRQPRGKGRWHRRKVGQEKIEPVASTPPREPKLKINQ